MSRWTALPPEPFFSGAGLDRADGLRADRDALAALAQRSDARQLQWVEELPAIGKDGRLVWNDLASPDLFLGFDDGAPRFCAIESVKSNARASFPRMALLDACDAPLFAAALSLARWHGRHAYCASCGHPSELDRGGWSRRCPACGAEHYPRVDPVVIMLAEHEGRVLLGRQPTFPPQSYSALAGFVEVGENLEAAVAREFFEEAGIRVHSIRYVASQPWPFPSSLMLGFHAETDSEQVTVDMNELEDVRWFSRDDVAAALQGQDEAPFRPPPETAIARTLLERWLAA